MKNEKKSLSKLKIGTTKESEKLNESTSRSFYKESFGF